MLKYFCTFLLYFFLKNLCVCVGFRLFHLYLQILMSREMGENKHITVRMTAILLLALFAFFSIQLPLLSCEANENMITNGKPLILQQDYLLSISRYYAANTLKFDFGKHRIISFLFLKLENWILIAYSQKYEITERLFSLPFSSVPIYILVRVLRN